MHCTAMTDLCYTSHHPAIEKFWLEHCVPPKSCPAWALIEYKLHTAEALGLGLGYGLVLIKRWGDNSRQGTIHRITCPPCAVSYCVAHHCMALTLLCVLCYGHVHATCTVHI